MVSVTKSNSSSEDEGEEARLTEHQPLCHGFIAHGFLASWYYIASCSGIIRLKLILLFKYPCSWSLTATCIWTL